MATRPDQHRHNAQCFLDVVRRTLYVWLFTQSCTFTWPCDIWTLCGVETFCFVWELWYFTWLCHHLFVQRRSVLCFCDHVVRGHCLVTIHNVVMFTWPCCTWALFGDYTQCGHVYVTIILYVDIVWWLYTMWSCLRDHNIVRGHCLVSETRPCVFLTHRLSLKETLRFFWAVFLAFTASEEVSELRFSVIKFFSPPKYQYLSTIGEVFLGKMQENQRVEKGLTAE